MRNAILSVVTKSDIGYPLLLFSAALIIRLIPELLAYPYPIGYDVINYYLPVITNFDQNWNGVSSQFPLYVLILHSINIMTSSDPLLVVQIAAILIFGFFALAVYFLSRSLLHLQQSYSFFLSIFVIFQLSVLRTSWDLHRDMLSITTMLLAINFISNRKGISKKIFAILILLCIVTALGDRMIGLLFTASILIYSAITKDKKIIIIASVTTIVFSVALFQGIGGIEHNFQVSNRNIVYHNIYSPINLVILFIVTNAFLIPAGIIGFRNNHQIILKIPFILSFLGCLSLIASSINLNFLPDRWVFIFSIFLSIYSGYGFLSLINKRCRSSRKQERLAVIVLLVPFIILGGSFAITNADAPLSIYVPFHRYVGQFVPMTMQYNSLSMAESKSILSAIDWINNNTPMRSNIIIDIRWKGWAEIALKQRSYQFYSGPIQKGNGNDTFYLLVLNSMSVPQFENTQLQHVYNNERFSLYRMNFHILI